MIKIGICDDNATLLEKYQKMIENICKQKNQEVEIITFSDGREVVESFTKDKNSIDVLFLDILMERLNGVETARYLRKIKSKVIIIFLTSSEEYIFDSMDIKALAYLMKDQVSSETMEKVLQNAISKVETRRSESLHFEKDGGAYSLSYADISFIKVYKSFCYIHHWDGIIFESSDLSILKTLNQNFFKVHEQYIINFQYVGKIEKNCIILSDDSQNEIPLDKQYERELKLRFAQFMMEKM